MPKVAFRSAPVGKPLCRGRDGSYLPPPAQIPACGFSAPGSCRRSDATGIRGLGGPSSSGPWAQAVGDMPGPALCPGHALAFTLPSTGRLPSTLSAPDLSAGVVRGFIGTMQPPPTFRSGFGSSPSRTDLGPPWRLRAAGGLPGSDTILDASNWSQTPVERRLRWCTDAVVDPANGTQ
jgi:hypothetical protein